MVGNPELEVGNKRANYLCGLKTEGTFILQQISEITQVGALMDLSNFKQCSHLGF